MSDLVEIFKDYAAVKDWRAHYVTLQDKEFQISDSDMTGGESVLLIFPFTEDAVMNSKIGIIDYWRASTRVWLGRKFDNTSTTGTESSIEETLEQKDERRLKVLRTDMNAMIKAVFCAGDNELLSASINLEFNLTNESMDFVVANFIFKQ